MAGDAARESSGKQIESLTVLRGVAAATVLLSHCLRLGEASYFGETATRPPGLEWLDLGFFGVVLFFVLSGFTIQLNYGSTALAPAPIGRFLLRRFFRIYPAYLVSLLAYLALDAALAGQIAAAPSSWLGEFGQPVTTPILLEYLALTYNWTGHWFYINNVYWSLPIEFQFYLLFPALLLLLRAGPAYLLLGTATLYAIGWGCGLDSVTPQLAWQFTGGMVAAWLVGRTRRRLSLLPAALILSLAAVAIVWIRFAAPEFYIPGMANPLIPSSTALFYGLAAILLVLTVTAADAKATGRLWRALLWQGETSYSLYLYHNAALLLCYAAIMSGKLADGPRWALIYLVGVPTSYLLAWASAMLVEQPGIALGRRLAALGFGRRPLADLQARTLSLREGTKEI